MLGFEMMQKKNDQAKEKGDIKEKPDDQMPPPAVPKSPIPSEPPTPTVRKRGASQPPRLRRTRAQETAAEPETTLRHVKQENDKKKAENDQNKMDDEKGNEELTEEQKIKKKLEDQQKIIEQLQESEKKHNGHIEELTTLLMKERNTLRGERQERSEHQGCA